MLELRGEPGVGASVMELAGVVVEPVEYASGSSFRSETEGLSDGSLLDWLTMAGAGPTYRPVADVEGIVFLSLVLLGSDPVVFVGRGCRSGKGTAACLICAGGEENCEMKREAKASPEWMVVVG